ncbi:MAG: GNAT family N-acetyltransferase [Candidatus Heimdallarchaeota archaeon]|nr:GNAT family N-acetyltransferase [Candidatus Heimdallarchaeota archaeon]
MIAYRAANLEDIDLLVNLRIEFLYEALALPKETPAKALRKSLKNYFQRKMPKKEFIAWLAFNNDECIATSGLSFYDVPPVFSNPSGKKAYIMNMYTRPPWRRKGIGTELLKRLLEEIKTRRIKVVVLHATEMGKTLYEKFGFRETNEMELKIGEIK